KGASACACASQALMPPASAGGVSASTHRALLARLPSQRPKAGARIAECSTTRWRGASSERDFVRSRSKLLPYFLVASISFVGGGAFVASVGAAGASTYRSLDIFAKVLAYVENSYVDETDPRVLIEGAIRGMLDTLDPHSVYLPAEDYRNMKADTAGEFGGLGLEVKKEDGKLLVVQPLEDSPAMRAGILPGDWIVAIEE